MEQPSGQSESFTTLSTEKRLVGHRGWPQVYPENSLAGFEAAISAGALAIECDVQFSRDGDPMVIHDADVRRTSDRRGKVADLSATELSAININEPSRLGASAVPMPVPRLSELVELVGRYPQVQLFVEIKEESFAAFSRDYCAQSVLEAITPIGSQALVISFDADVLLPARESGAAIGWVIRAYNTKTQVKAAALKPNVLICDYHKLPAAPAPLWPGTWQWFVYDIVDPAVATAHFERGVTYVETWDIGPLLKQLGKRSA